MLTVIFRSAGVKNGPLPKADYMIDCRSISNPFHIKELGGKSGDDKEVQEFVLKNSNIGAMYDLLNEALTRIPSRRQGEDPYAKPFEVLCFCAHGVHRSKAVKNILSGWLKMDTLNGSIGGEQVSVEVQ